ncbi:hypothetical protein [Mesorhizobium sp. INR15]|uniref:hypothetical protein n=1 Tax=Mesorhizobium sp. INR15 TaxID=2654248 RepID=UPI0018966F47|nr:hypothetical protein [Mesorhizobium sp. INR15]QPC93087.1 hypothetical protein GA829_22320 [Mesorhizobium sp. INR15]
MIFRDGSYAILQPAKRAALVNFGIHHWRWSAIPVCICLLWLIFPGDDRAELVAAQGQLAAANAQLGLMQRVKRNAIQQAHMAADAAAQQGRALRDSAQRKQSVALDLEAAHGAITSLKAKAVLAEEARNAMAASLAQANRAFDQERRRVELTGRDLALARQASDTNNTSADQAAIELAGALKGRQVAEANLNLSNNALQHSLQVARAQADLAARDLDVAHQERDAATQAAAEQHAALEEERQKALAMAINLSAARSAIDLVKSQSARRSARIGRAIEASVAAIPLASQSARQRNSSEKGNSKVHKSSKRVVVATTVTLPDALLPTTQGPRQ